MNFLWLPNREMFFMVRQPLHARRKELVPQRSLQVACKKEIRAFGSLFLSFISLLDA
jgi:hypothetical protein